MPNILPKNQIYDTHDFQVENYRYTPSFDLKCHQHVAKHQGSY